MPGQEVVASRNWYLANLGIVRYVPREDMAREDAGGEEAPTLPVDADYTRTASADNHLPAADSSQVHKQATDRERPRIDLGEAGPAVRQSPPAPAIQEQQSAAEAFQCRIGFWQPSSRIAVLSAMSPGQRPTPVQVTMLANLLKAIGALGEGLPPVDLIDWPPSPGLGLQGGADLHAARDYLGVFLQAKRRLQDFDTLLLMGDIVARACGGDEGLAVGQQLDLALGVRGIVTHSLHAMEQTPALKAETWQAIRFLAG
jgi:hypothetical protein